MCGKTIVGTNIRVTLLLLLLLPTVEKRSKLSFWKKLLLRRWSELNFSERISYFLDCSSFLNQI
jgi:hypothetical protein